MRDPYVKNRHHSLVYGLIMAWGLTVFVRSEWGSLGGWTGGLTRTRGLLVPCFISPQPLFIAILFTSVWMVGLIHVPLA